MFVDMEAAILARLRAKIPDVPAFTEDDIERVPDLRQKAPAIVVIYNGYTVDAEQAGNYRAARLTQEWLIVATSKRATKQGGTTDARDDSASQAERIIAALLGFQPRPGAYLRLRDAPGPEYDGGYCYLPLAFFVEATVKGDGE